MEKYYMPMCRHSGLYQEILAKIVRLARTYHPEPRPVADFGCGPGLITDRLMRVFLGIERVDGFDNSVGLGKIGVDSFVRLRNVLGRRLFFFEGPEGDLIEVELAEDARTALLPHILGLEREGIKATIRVNRLALIQIGNQRLENFTSPAELHLLLPVLLNPAFADRAIDKPAQMASPKFPGGAFLFDF